MKYLTFLFALICLYSLVHAKGEVAQRKESPLRKALRATTEAPVFVAVRARPAVSKTVVQRQPVLTRPLQVVRQQPAVVRQELPVVQQQDQQPELVVFNRQPVVRPRELNVIRATRPVVENVPRNVEVVSTNVEVQPLAVRPVVENLPRNVEVVSTNVEVQPLAVRPVVNNLPRNFEVISTNVEVQPLAVRPVVARRVVQPTVVVSQEQVEQGADDTDDSLSNAQVQQELVQEPAPLKRVVSQTRKLEAPQQTRRRFNVLLRTAEGFNEKAGYSVLSSRSVL